MKKLTITIIATGPNGGGKTFAIEDMLRTLEQSFDVEVKHRENTIASETINITAQLKGQ